jgi:DeoR/GlpR family transcriptional regulator of sugar metabolism
MFPEQRYMVIQDTAREQGFVSLDQLCDITQSSEATIRRDIAKLLKEGKIEKVLGGIVPADTSDNNDPQSPLLSRMVENHDEKERIGKAAQALIEDGDIVFIHGGTTCLEVAKYIDRKKSLTVITDHLGIVSVLRNSTNIELFLLGGKVENKQQLVSGPMVVAMLETFNPNKTIMGCGGISLEKGVTNYHYYGAEIEKKIIELSNELIFVMDHTKFHRNGLCQISGIDAIDTIVTDNGLESHLVESYRSHHINMILA